MTQHHVNHISPVTARSTMLPFRITLYRHIDQALTRPAYMHLHRSLIGSPCSKAFSTLSRCRGYVSAARGNRGNDAQDHKVCASRQSAQEADQATVAASYCTAPAATSAADHDAVAPQQSVAGRRRRNSNKGAVQTPAVLHNITPLMAVGSAADAAAQAAASKALQLHSHMAAAFIRNSVTQGLKGTGVSIVKQNEWAVALTSKDVQGRTVKFRRSCGPVTNGHRCLVAAAAADLARLAVFGRDKISDAQLPSIFGDALLRSRPRLMANLPLALYDDEDIQTWRALLQLEQPYIMLHAGALPVTHQRQHQELHKQSLPRSSETAVKQQPQMRQQQNSTPDVPKVAAALPGQPAAWSDQQQCKRSIRAAASAAVAAAVQSVRQHAEERPGIKANSPWAFMRNPVPPRGSCVSLRGAGYRSPWRTRVTLPGAETGDEDRKKTKWNAEFQKYWQTPLEAAVAADLVRLAMHGRRQPSSSGCVWNFPMELYKEEHIHAVGRLIQQTKPYAKLSGMG